jgi:hypothetical protein
MVFAGDPILSFSEPRFSGAGCPQGSVSFLPTEDAFTLLFDSYLAERGPQVPVKERVKHCFIQVNVDVPAGFQAVVENIDYRGFTRLENKVQSYFISSFSFGTVQAGSSPVKYFRGPQGVDFFKRDLPYFTRAGRCLTRQIIPLRIATFLGVSGSSKYQGVISLDSIDGVVAAKLSVQPCRR